jgi:AraC family transcriptional regulator of adaptative response / DNA-3-methyladenine glycosylase II
MWHHRYVIATTSTPDKLYADIMARDERYDGIFFFAVTSTGIYCRPSCPARRPLKENCRFFESAREAEEHDFRACKRCHPHQPTTSDVIKRLYKDSSDNLSTAENTEKTPTVLSLGERQIRRLVKSNIGKTPAKIYRLRRLQQAYNLLQDTDLSILDIAFRVDFSSIRQFNYAFKQRYGISPRQMRKSKEVL